MLVAELTVSVLEELLILIAGRDDIKAPAGIDGAVVIEADRKVCIPASDATDVCVRL